MSDQGPQEIEKLDKNFAAMEAPQDLRWVDIREFTIEGKGWDDTEGPFDRLPARAKGFVPDGVWNLASRPAGVAARFITDATRIAARWTLRFEALGKSHMPATGVSGLDLYVKDRDTWCWVGVGRPEKFPTSEQALVRGFLAAGEREFRLYLPLYNALESAEIGIPKDASVQAARVSKEKPIVIYGTSIVQGGVAARAGMAHPAILGRRLGRVTINLGFSGNGRMDMQLAELLGELDVCAYVLDCLPNMTPPLVTERAAPFVRTLRQLRPQTPIVLVENIRYQDADFVIPRRQRYTASNAALRQAYAALLTEGVENLLYVPGDKLLGDDGESTVDGTHPTDLGFIRIADALEPVLRDLL